MNIYPLLSITPSVTHVFILFYLIFGNAGCNSVNWFLWATKGPPKVGLIVHCYEKVWVQLLFSGKKPKKFWKNYQKQMYTCLLMFLLEIIWWHSAGYTSESNNLGLKINNTKMSLNRDRAPSLIEMEEK